MKTLNSELNTTVVLQF